MSTDELTTTDPDLSVGTKVGEYVIERKLGAGTFGAVYGAIQPLIGKQVAVKVLSRKYSADPSVVSRFIAEARAVNQIRHKNIIDIFSFGQIEDGRHYHVMELLEGETLDVYVRRQGGRVGITDLIPIMRGLGRALDAAHASGIAHRDLKPANVFLGHDEEGRAFPKLLDFGIAKLLTDDLPKQHSTATGAAVGTPDYMSPEQCQGPNVDHRTDVYSFGVMLFQLMTGHLPFKGASVVELLMKHMTAPAPKPSEVAPDLDVALDAPVLAMLAKAPDERPPSLAAAMAQFEEAAREAGYDVPTHQSGEVSGPVALSSGSVTPPSMQPAFAETIPSAVSAEAIAPTAPGRARLIAIVVGLAMLVVVTLPFVLDSKPRAKAELPPPAPPPVLETPPIDTEPEAPKSVMLWFDGAPAGARVFLDDELIGTAPGPTAVPRSEEPVTLKFQAEGYEDAVQSVALTANATVTVVMTEEKVRSARTKKRPPPPPTKKKRVDPDSTERPDW